VKRAFDHCAEDYARYRPPYAVGVFELLDRHATRKLGRVAADVGAGTGIFARSLAAHGWSVVAIEPSLAMLRQVWLGGSPPRPICDLALPRYPNSEGRIVRLCATAEQTALANASVALVTAAQAFHWFNPPHALAEFARILKPGGWLALTWNNRDATKSAFVEQYEQLIVRYNPAYEREYREQDWPAKIAENGAFEPATHRCFDHLWRLPSESFVGFSRSVSYIRNVLSRAQQPYFESELRELLRRHFAETECHIPLRTDLWTARRR
jgi:SAM-dependent methyltransferase